MTVKNTAFLNVKSCNLVQCVELRRSLLQSTQHHIKEEYLSQYILNYGLDIEISDGPMTAVKEQTD